MKAEIVGKPAANFFLSALEDMDISPEDVSSNFSESVDFNILFSSFRLAPLALFKVNVLLISKTEERA